LLSGASLGRISAESGPLTQHCCRDTSILLLLLLLVVVVPVVVVVVVVVVVNHLSLALQVVILVSGQRSAESGPLTQRCFQYTKVRPYSCPDCEQKFTRIDHLRRHHLRLHSVPKGSCVVATVAVAVVVVVVAVVIVIVMQLCQMYKLYILYFSISSILPVVTSRSTSHNTVLRGSILLYMSLYMSYSRQSVCGCNNRILYCILSILEHCMLQ